MFILKKRAGDRLLDLLIFDKYEEALDCIETCPFLRQDHYQVDDVQFSDYYFKPEDLPDYIEWVYGEIKIPLSKWSYPNIDRVDLEIHEVSHTSEVKEGFPLGATQVDAWFISYEDTQKYIEAREKLAEEIQYQLKLKGYTQISREFFGSEDGEAILYQDTKGHTHFFTHLDPSLVDEYLKSDLSLQRYVEGLIVLEEQEGA